MQANNSNTAQRADSTPIRTRVAAGLGCAVVVLTAGCTSEAPTPDSPDQSYLRAVNAANVPFETDDVAIKVGQGMCELVERAVLNGQTVEDAKTILKQQSDRAGVYSTSQNTTIIVAAMKSYCPEYLATK